MNKELCALNFMYDMERFATQIYLTQYRAFARSEIEDKLKKASVNERQHVEYLHKRVIELDGIPSRLGFLFQLAGILMGSITMCLGRLFILKADTWVEKRAIKDYGSFIKKLNFDSETDNLLKKIIADEEQHVETWQNSIRVLKGEPERAELIYNISPFLFYHQSLVLVTATSDRQMVSSSQAWSIPSYCRNSGYNPFV